MDMQHLNERQPNPRVKANCLSAFFFTWVWQIFKRGLSKELEIEDLYAPLKEHKSDYLGDKYERAWLAETSSRKQPSLLRVLLKCCFAEYALYNIMLTVMELVFRLAQPIFLGQLILYFEPDSDISLGMAYLHACGVVFCTGVYVFVRQHYMLGVFHLGMKMRVGVCSMVYRKSLRLTHGALKQTTIGQIVNMLSNDVSRFENDLIHLQYLWLGPLQMLIILYFMWNVMGISAVIGIVIALLFIPLQGCIGKKIAGLRLRCAYRTDERVRLMNEIIAGIQVIKLYTWEIPFIRLVAHSRLMEISVIRVTSYLRAVMFSFERFTTRLTLFITVFVYVLLGNVITAEKVFVVASFFSILRVSMTDFFPRGIFTAAETMVAIRRLEKFLRLEELPRNQQDNAHDIMSTEKIIPDKLDGEKKIQNFSSEHLDISIRGVTAKWDAESNENTLTNIDLHASAGQLLAIIGPVGAGKTSLLHTILGELRPTCGSVHVEGKVSYASQEPWLFSSSVRNNILFGEQFDRQRYRAVVKACALQRDLGLLPQGDMTLVGERGVALSGGQRARINLARAIYKVADIYILDDPLSAVDSHVSKHLFEQCICGFLKKKTRILVTHQLQHLGHVNHIVILNGGKMQAEGTFSELQNSGLDFAKLLGDQGDDQSAVDRGPAEDAARHRLDTTTSMESNSSSLDDNQNEVAVPTVQEMRVRGKVAKQTYSSYIFASESYTLLLLLLLSMSFAQILFCGSDYWLSYWTNKETGILESAGTNLTSDRTWLDQNIASATEPYNSSSHDSAEMYILQERNFYIYVFAGLTLGAIFLIMFATFLFFHLCMKSSIHLHNRMFTSVITLPLKFFTTTPTGQILNRFSKDMGIIDEQLPLVMLDCLGVTFLIVGIMTLVAVVNYWILLPTIFVVIFLYFMRRTYIPTARSVRRIEGITCSPVFSHLSTSLQGLTTIRALRAERMLHHEFDSHQDLYSGAYYLFMVGSRAFGLWLDIVCLLYICCVTLSFLVLGRDVLGGDVGLAISQSLSLTGMFQWGMRQSAELQNVMTSVERVLDYTKIEREPAIESHTNKKLAEGWPSKGEMIFDKVFLYYSVNGAPILKNLNFTVKPAEKIGIVGRTGAGKSSLIAALFQLTHTEGSIIIDGVDTKSIGLHELRRNISIIPQEPVLFSGALRRNLDQFDEYPDAVLWKALEEVELKQVVKDLPAGLNHKISEGGSNFSVGQRQLICLARAIVRRNKILVMDEATANVDPQTDVLIQVTVRRKFRDCTVMTIAHRLATVMDSDRILVMDAGRVMEFDHPFILLQNRGGFLWSMVEQMGDSTAESLFAVAEKSYCSSSDYKLQ